MCVCMYATCGVYTCISILFCLRASVCINPRTYIHTHRYIHAHIHAYKPVTAISCPGAWYAWGMLSGYMPRRGNRQVISHMYRLNADHRHSSAGLASLSPPHIVMCPHFACSPLYHSAVIVRPRKAFYIGNKWTTIYGPTIYACPYLKRGVFM